MHSHQIGKNIMKFKSFTIRTCFIEQCENTISTIFAPKADSVTEPITAIEHPGFPFSLGCGKWEENGFMGQVKCWSGIPLISWSVNIFIHLMNK